MVLDILMKQYKSIESIECDKCLKKGNIICTIDNYKINSDGLLIINDKNNIYAKIKTIPLKSYIWFFKNSSNNILVFENILPNNYRGNLAKLAFENNEIFINDSHIKKQINLSKSNITLNSHYELISSFGYEKLKYISCGSIKLMELNEGIIQIISPLFSNDMLKYGRIIDKIRDNKYTNNGKKMLLIINTKKTDNLMKIVSDNIKNFDDLLNKYKTKKEQKKFLSSYK
jgi:hypothetical protein